jgi:hypothetical protein
MLCYVETEHVYECVSGWLLSDLLRNFCLFKNVCVGLVIFQIVSLGAGFDSAFFRLKAEGLMKECSFFEVNYI